MACGCCSTDLPVLITPNELSKVVLVFYSQAHATLIKFKSISSDRTVSTVGIESKKITRDKSIICSL